MLCVPAVRVDIVNIATPLPFSERVPIAAVPSLKVTVPVGVGPPVTPVLTVAVRVTV